MGIEYFVKWLKFCHPPALFDITSCVFGDCTSWVLLSLFPSFSTPILFKQRAPLIRLVFLPRLTPQALLYSPSLPNRSLCVIMGNCATSLLWRPNGAPSTRRGLLMSFGWKGPPPTCARSPFVLTQHHLQLGKFTAAHVETPARPPYELVLLCV